MTSALNKLPDNSFELTINIPWVEVKPVYETVIEKFVSEIEVEGFRKGKAPRDLALKKIDQGHIFGETINNLLPKVYSEAIRQNNLTPIVNPKVQIISTEEEKEWVFKAISCERPGVDLANSLEEIKSINAKGKIWTPGSANTENKVKDAKQESEEKNKRISDIIGKLLELVKIIIPEVVIEQETSRLISQLVDDVRAAGLTLDQYINSKGTTGEQLQTQFKSQAEATLKLEFILEEIAKQQKITVEENEIDAIINKETDEKAKQTLKAQSYLLAAVLRREKTLTYLANL